MQLFTSDHESSLFQLKTITRYTQIFTPNKLPTQITLHVVFISSIHKKLFINADNSPKCSVWIWTQLAGTVICMKRCKTFEDGSIDGGFWLKWDV